MMHPKRGEEVQGFTVVNPCLNYVLLVDSQGKMHKMCYSNFKQLKSNTMAILVNASIDLTKIDKSKIFEKDGKKWLNLTIALNDEVTQYGQNVSISVSQSKEEKDQPKTYLGNGKIVWSNGKVMNAIPKDAPAPNPVDDDLGF